MRDTEKTSYLHSANAPFIAELYEKYLSNPNTVDASWQEFFRGLKDNPDQVARELEPHQTKIIGAVDDAVKNGKATPTDKKGAVSDQAVLDTIRALTLIRLYRVRGHLEANIDPLGMRKRTDHPELQPEHYGFTADDYDRPIFINEAIPGVKSATLREIVDILQQTYCGSVGIEYMHIHDIEIKAWLEGRIETIKNHTDFTDLGRQTILERLTEAEHFEQFLHTKYVGTKRFGLDGGEAVIPAMEQLIKKSSMLGVKEVVLGMPHRGRLNILCNVLGKSYRQIFAEFLGYYELPMDTDVSGDVKYHLGASSDRDLGEGPVHLSLTANPSHLEAVNPVVLGKVRAKQDMRGDEGRDEVMGILLHGDAAFAGQGIVPECLLLSELNGYKTSGTIHFIVNNQIGFTTRPVDSRSSEYCSDIAKMIQAPIFHVNGDDVEAVVHVARVASEFRAKFKKDVVIDMYCYRRYGHNEGDEPAFTQPAMYKIIKDQRSVRAKYAQELIDSGTVDPHIPNELEDKMKGVLTEAFESAQTRNVEGKGDWLKGAWKGITHKTIVGEKQKTGVGLATLKEVGTALTKLPEGFNLHSKLQRLFKQKEAMFESGEGIDWGTAEALAFGTLLLEDYTVRLSGQDCKRGTFSHRHAVVFDQNTEEQYTSLSHIRDGQKPFEVINSPLSEEAVLGYEYGYTQADPNSMVMWEAQFGDFVNGAQMIIDQFISSGETKWLRMSGLTMLLPHGFEGQGPEHSSARPERFLQLCAEDNIQVANCSTPASYFHILRRQLHRDFRKPLVIMTPKSLLRHKLCTSTLEDMGPDTQFQRVIGEIDKLGKNIKRIVLCTGKVYYDLLQERRDRGIDNIAIVRTEQLYPFPEKELVKEFKKYPDADVIWCQEEPENQGYWFFMDRRIEGALATAKHKTKRPAYVGRKEGAAPATGIPSRHAEEQITLIDTALTV